MLILNRKLEEEIIIDYYGKLIRVKVLRIRHEGQWTVRLGIDAPREVRIRREDNNE